MKKYSVKVNGVDYDVEIEEIRSRTTERVHHTVQYRPQAVTHHETESAAVAHAPQSGAGTITAPMPGTIVGIKVNVGDTVKRGQTLLVLEAMKMENEISSPQDGTVSAIHCSQGTYVSTGTPLCDVV